MKLAYPASLEVSNLSNKHLALKIARHYPCSSCLSCSGLHPTPGTHVVLDDDPALSPIDNLEQYGSDDDDDGNSHIYLDSCDCGHGIAEHGALEADIGTEEFMRRSRIAVRLDRYLKDVGRLLDFEYTDADIIGLRTRMKAAVSKVAPSIVPKPSGPTRSPLSSASSASSELSDIPPPSKRRRISFSSLSDDEDDDDDEEDRPLAARMNQRAQKASKSPRMPLTSRGGKRPPPPVPIGKKVPAGRGPPPSKKPRTSSTSLPPRAPPLEEPKPRTNGVHAHIKLEDKMDEGQINRLATGVTVDTGTRLSADPPSKAEKPSTIELRKGIIKIVPVENDGLPRSLVILTGLKTLFQKQLPNMPREYIARLVYDSNAKSLAIIKRGYKVVGGICYRPFPHRGFAEIAFFATNSVDQVKGYGGMLMDHFKAHIKKTYPDMMHFLTYADNFAVGYFEKQGFSKKITLDRSIWAGYIKDYEGGTIMQCTMVRKFDYLDKVNIFARQQEAILSKIRQMSKSHIVYKGLPQFQDGADPNVTVDPKDVPGLRETGWTHSMAADLIRAAPRSSDQLFMENLLRDLENHSCAWPFAKPVDGNEVSDYYDIIKHPMDFTTLGHKLETNQYTRVEAFLADIQLIYDNCRLYNTADSIYAKHANTMEKFTKAEAAKRMKQEE